MADVKLETDLREEFQALRADFGSIGSCITLSQRMGCAHKAVAEQKAYFCALVAHVIPEEDANIFLAAIGAIEPYADISKKGERQEQYYKDHLKHKGYARPADSLRKIEDKVAKQLTKYLLGTSDLNDLLKGLVEGSGTSSTNNMPKQQDEVKPNYYKLGQAAIETQNLESLTLALNSLSNHNTVLNLLKDLAKSEECMRQEGFVSLFHERLSKMTNNVYIYRVFEACLREGYFKDKPEELLDPHLKEISNQVYVYDTLVFMLEHGMGDLAEKYKGKLTSKKYAKKFEGTRGVEVEVLVVLI